MKTCKWCKHSKTTWDKYVHICGIGNKYVKDADADECEKHETNGTDTLNLIDVERYDNYILDISLSGKFSVSISNRVLFVNEFIDLIDKYRLDSEQT